MSSCFSLGVQLLSVNRPSVMKSFHESNGVFLSKFLRLIDDENESMFDSIDHGVHAHRQILARSILTFYLSLFIYLLSFSFELFSASSRLRLVYFSRPLSPLSFLFNSYSNTSFARAYVDSLSPLSPFLLNTSLLLRQINI